MLLASCVFVTDNPINMVSTVYCRLLQMIVDLFI